MCIDNDRLCLAQREPGHKCETFCGVFAGVLGSGVKNWGCGETTDSDRGNQCSPSSGGVLGSITKKNKAIRHSSRVLVWQGQGGSHGFLPCADHGCDRRTCGCRNRKLAVSLGSCAFALLQWRTPTANRPYVEDKTRACQRPSSLPLSVALYYR